MNTHVFTIKTYFEYSSQYFLFECSVIRFQSHHKNYPVGLSSNTRFTVINLPQDSELKIRCENRFQNRHYVILCLLSIIQIITIIRFNFLDTPITCNFHCFLTRELRNRANSWEFNLTILKTFIVTMIWADKKPIT